MCELPVVLLFWYSIVPTFLVQQGSIVLCWPDITPVAEKGRLGMKIGYQSNLPLRLRYPPMTQHLRFLSSSSCTCVLFQCKKAGTVLSWIGTKQLDVKVFLLRGLNVILTWHLVSATHIFFWRPPSDFFDNPSDLQRFMQMFSISSFGLLFAFPLHARKDVGLIEGLGDFLDLPWLTRQF